MSQIAVSLKDVRIARGGQTILDIFRLEVRQNELLTIIGPNGSGKSTLLKVLSLLERPTAGSVYWGSKEVDYGNLLPLRRKLAVVFQEPLLRDCSVRDNVATGLSFRGLPGTVIRERTERWMERFGISHLAKRPARTLSGGEAQRVSLARAFAVEPEVLFLDEPFASLDAPSRATLIEDLEHVLAAHRITTVFVTHDRTEALVLGDRLGVMMGGCLEQMDTPERVFANPADEKVAAFVGVETIVPGRIVAQGEGLATVALTSGQDISFDQPPRPVGADVPVGPEWGGVITVDVVGDFPIGRHVLVCLRPEHVTLSPVNGKERRSSARNTLQGTITRVSPLGHVVRVTVDCGFDLVATVTRQSLVDLSLKPGTRVTASFKATAVHVIPKE